VLLHRRARQHHEAPPALELVDEVVRAAERSDLVDHPLELPFPLLAHGVAELPLDVGPATAAT